MVRKADKSVPDIQKLIQEGFDKTRKAIKEDTIQTVNQGFEELVAPELVKIEARLDNVETRLDRVELKLDRIESNQLEHLVQLKDHGKRLKDIESTPAVTHHLKK